MRRINPHFSEAAIRSRSRRPVRNAGYEALAVVLLGALTFACATNPAPPNWLTPIPKSDRDTFGGWVEVRYPKETKLAPVNGELIAVGDQTIHVFTASGLQEIPIADVASARASLYAPDTASVMLWATAGAISSVTHGVFLVVSLPAWLVIGRAAMGDVWEEAQVTFPERTWAEFRSYARFPQGLPLELDLGTLQAKPLQRPQSRN